MKYINCPNCGNKLFEGEEGSHIILKCTKCSKLFEATIERQRVVVTAKESLKEEKGIPERQNSKKE